MTLLTEELPASGHMIPTRAAERILPLDVIRGVALLGILLMNIASFGFPDPAYFQPFEFTGGAEGWNFKLWWINTIFFEGTMRGMFSILFGAGALLFITRAESRTPGIEAADLYYRRILLLILFGVIHAYLILWSGEILYNYGIWGMFLFPFRNAKPRQLLVFALVVMALGGVFQIRGYLMDKDLHKEFVAATAKKEKGEALDKKEEASIGSWEEKRTFHHPSKEQVAEEVAKMSGPYYQQILNLSAFNKFFQSQLTYSLFLYDILGMMLLGMALYKWQFLQGERTLRDYLLMFGIGYAVGLPLRFLEVNMIVESGYETLAFDIESMVYPVSRLFVTIGHLGLILTLVKLGWLKWLQKSLAAVGQMALTNYISHSLICNTIFLGFHQFGKWQRYELYFLVGGIWLFQLIMSQIWLKYYRFGPLEWLWRSLTYRERQPMLRT